MSATFDTALSTAKDRARLRLGLIDVATDPVLQDDTIEAAIDLYGEKEGTAILAQSVASVFYQRAETYDEADVKKVWRDRAKGMMDIAKAVRNGPNPEEPVNLDTTAGPAAAMQMARPDLSEYKTD